MRKQTYTCYNLLVYKDAEVDSSGKMVFTNGINQMNSTLYQKNGRHTATISQFLHAHQKGEQKHIQIFDNNLDRKASGSQTLQFTLKSILEMFAEEHHTAMTDAISNCFIEITTLIVSKQCILPGKALWDALQETSTAGGGKANSPSYATECVEVYNGPRVFPVGSRSLAIPINGSDVPDNLYLCVRILRNISSKHGSYAYLELPDVKTFKLTVDTQGRQAFDSPGTSPFNDATYGVSSRATLTAKTAIYDEYFKDTILKVLCSANGDALAANNKYLYDPENWVFGNTLWCIRTSTALSDEDDMKSSVYAAPFTVTLTLNSELAGTGLNLFGSSHGVLTITSNGDIISSRWMTGAHANMVRSRKQVSSKCSLRRL